GIAPGAHAGPGHYRHHSGDPASPGTPPTWLTHEILRVGAPRPHPTTATARSPATQQSSTAHAAYLQAVIRNGAADLATLTDGRKQALSALAYKVGGYLAWADQTESDVIGLLTAAGTAS